MNVPFESKFSVLTWVDKSWTVLLSWGRHGTRRDNDPVLLYFLWLDLLCARQDVLVPLVKEGGTRVLFTRSSSTWEPCSSRKLSCLPRSAFRVRMDVLLFRPPGPRQGEKCFLPLQTEKRNPGAYSGTQTRTFASTASVISFQDKLEGWKSRTDLARRDALGGCCHVSLLAWQHVTLLCGLARRISTEPVARLCPSRRFCDCR